jgi:hypothetical protein
VTITGVKLELMKAYALGMTSPLMTVDWQGSENVTDPVWSKTVELIVVFCYKVKV